MSAPAAVVARAERADGLAAVADGGVLQLHPSAGASTPGRSWSLPAAARQLSFIGDGRSLVAHCADGALRSFEVAADHGPRTVFVGPGDVAIAADGGAVVRPKNGPPIELAAADLAPGPGAAVDLRPWLHALGLPPRRQGARGTCSVFTAAGAYEFALARAAGRGAPLSVEFLNWAANDATGRVDDGSFFSDVVAGFQSHGACREELMPYRAAFDPALRPSAAAVEDATLARERGCVVHWIRPLPAGFGLEPAHLAAIKQTLALGWPVCLGSAHSTLAVGWRDDPVAVGGGAVVIRDSATGGYRELDYELVLKRIADVFWVEGQR